MQPHILSDPVTQHSRGESLPESSEKIKTTGPDQFFPAVSTTDVFSTFDRMFVCLLHLLQKKGSGYHSATVQKLSSVPTALRMPTNESKACCMQTKRGTMPTFETSNNHHWWFDCLPGTVQNKMAPRRTLLQYGCIVWRCCVAIPLLGNLRKGERLHQKKAGEKSDPSNRMLSWSCQCFKNSFQENGRNRSNHGQIYSTVKTKQRIHNE